MKRKPKRLSKLEQAHADSLYGAALLLLFLREDKLSRAVTKVADARYPNAR